MLVGPAGYIHEGATMEVDPTVIYLEMYYAMRDGKPALARRLAGTLDAMLQVGVYPSRYSQVEVRAYTTSVLRRTVGIREDEEPP